MDAAEDADPDNVGHERENMEVDDPFGDGPMEVG